MKETKSEHFRRIAEARVNKLIHDIRLMSNLATNTSSYEYTPEQADRIISALQYELDKVRAAFQIAPKRKSRFSLFEDYIVPVGEFDEPTIAPSTLLELPNDMYVRTVVTQQGDAVCATVFLDTKDTSENRRIVFVVPSEEEEIEYE